MGYWKGSDDAMVRLPRDRGAFNAGPKVKASTPAYKHRKVSTSGETECGLKQTVPECPSHHPTMKGQLKSIVFE